eukprot:CAMPEP_0175613152 /NCGR_PEP_ID=MMETSP0096-20121207/64196_1 /TAXON_ID=311494 /ORGANISM="Alexandrium monilatum, Strain CCMP3105" /LENGTH=223 /DNA_ID=CAMNT_0016918229 /DNA_START=33 /DNA_END=702 /DNA_ORIENTATION=-
MPARQHACPPAGNTRAAQAVYQEVLVCAVAPHDKSLALGRRTKSYAARPLPAASAPRRVAARIVLAGLLGLLVRRRRRSSRCSVVGGQVRSTEAASVLGLEGQGVAVVLLQADGAQAAPRHGRQRLQVPVPVRLRDAVDTDGVDFGALRMGEVERPHAILELVSGLAPPVCDDVHRLQVWEAQRLLYGIQQAAAAAALNDSQNPMASSMALCELFVSCGWNTS